MSALVPPHGGRGLRPLQLEGELRAEELRRAQTLRRLRITSREKGDLINRDDALVVDLRPAADFEKGHIAGAKNVQMAQFDPENKFLAPAKALPVVLVCKSGETASGAAKRLGKAGFANVNVLEGGIVAWQSADLPLVKGR